MATDKGEAEITAWCVAHLAKALRRPAEKIDPQTKFARLGVDFRDGGLPRGRARGMARARACP